RSNESPLVRLPSTGRYRSGWRGCCPIGDLSGEPPATTECFLSEPTPRRSQSTTSPRPLPMWTLTGPVTVRTTSLSEAHAGRSTSIRRSKKPGSPGISASLPRRESPSRSSPSGCQPARMPTSPEPLSVVEDGSHEEGGHLPAGDRLVGAVAVRGEAGGASGRGGGWGVGGAGAAYGVGEGGLAGGQAEGADQEGGHLSAGDGLVGAVAVRGAAAGDSGVGEGCGVGGEDVAFGVGEGGLAGGQAEGADEEGGHLSAGDGLVGAVAVRG